VAVLHFDNQGQVVGNRYYDNHAEDASHPTQAGEWLGQTAAPCLPRARTQGHPR